MNQLIKLAVSAACLGAAAGAYALPASEYNGGTAAPLRESYFSGATAQDRLIESILRIQPGLGVTQICADGTLDQFTARVPNIDGVAGTVVVSAYFCRAGNAIGSTIAAGNEVVVHKEAGGSAKGFTPFSPTGDPRRYLSMEWVKNNPTRCPLTSTSPGTPELNPLPIWNCGTLTAADVAAGAVTDVANPVAGISDVDGAAIVDPEVTDAALATISQTPTNSLVFGIAATQKFRDALQSVQSLVVGSNTEANMPSISIAQARALFTTANITKTTIGQYFVDSSGTALNASAVVADPPAVTTMYVCRRAVTSGTQASFATHYLAEGCFQGAPTFAGPANSGSYTVGSNQAARIWSGTGSADVGNCLQDRNQNDRWAVGILTTELDGFNLNGANPDTDAGWRFLKVDGFAPTLLNTVVGDYSHFAEAVLTTGAAGSASPFSAAQPEDQDVANYLATNLGLEPLIELVNANFSGTQLHAWGDAGYLALRPTGAGVAPLIAAQGASPTAASVSNFPVGRATRLGRGCVQPQLEIQTPAL